MGLALGPSSESLQGRNPREVKCGAGARYGDLTAAMMVGAGRGGVAIG
jgi:hypothetical protein